MKRILVPALGFGLLLGGVAFADHNNDVKPSDSSLLDNDTRRSTTPMPSVGETDQTMDQHQGVAQDDRSFMIKAAQGGMAEVKLGQLALEKASNPEVKTFARHMVQDHTKAAAELAQVATRVGVTLPKDLNSDDQKLYDKLSKMSGEEFDHAYMEAMVEDHDKDVSEFQTNATKVQNPIVRSWVQRTLPTLKHHQSMARRDLHTL